MSEDELKLAKAEAAFWRLRYLLAVKQERQEIAHMIETNEDLATYTQIIAAIRARGEQNDTAHTSTTSLGCSDS